MLSLFLGRAALRTTFASSSLLKSRVGTLATRPLAARTFLTTSRIQYPAKEKDSESAPKATKAKSTKTTKTTKTSAAAKKGGRKPAAKKAAPKRKPAAKKAAKPKKPAKVHITAEDKPPKKPAGPYLIFWTRFVASQAEKPKSVQDVARLTTESTRLWREMTDEEKKPFFEEAKGAMDEYYKARTEYYENVSPEVIKELNKRAMKRGGRRIRLVTPESERRPISGFFRFLAEFRPQYFESHEFTSGKLPAATKAASEKWRSMSDAEKEKYNEPANRDWAAWKAKQQEKASASS